MPQNKALLPRKKATHPPDIGIGKLLRRAHMAFSRQFRLRLQAHDMTFGEFVHLEKLWQEDGLNQTEISRRAGVETASSTAILDRLEKRGYVSRERNGADRRNINVFLRPKGAALEVPLLACARSINLVARERLSRLEVLMFFELMQRIVGNLEADDAPAAVRDAAADMPAARPRRLKAKSKGRAATLD